METQEYRKFRSSARLNLTMGEVPYRGGLYFLDGRIWGNFKMNMRYSYLLTYPPPHLGKIGRFWRNIVHVETLGWVIELRCAMKADKTPPKNTMRFGGIGGVS